MTTSGERQPPRGRYVDIGGRKLRIVCEGPKGPGPTVIFESGAFGFSADWAEVQSRLQAQGVRSCAYDRAGLGYSDEGPQPRDGIAVAEDLEKLLVAAEIPPPYVLVGHSMAGVRIWLFYERNKDKVQGLVFVDAATPYIVSRPESDPILNGFSALSRLAGLGASVGVLKAFGFMGDTIGLPPEPAAEKRWAFGDAEHNRIAVQEVVLWRKAAEQATAAGDLDPDLPVAVITAGHGDGGPWNQIYAEPAKRARHGYAVNIASANHANLLGFRHAGEIVKAIDFVLSAAHDRSSGSGQARAGG
ncbi:MAG TPA: alpha/beta fold hydrolase [Caulobacteraceae bacterium]|nr:alpha/beta fold hydrolase [Caulobacteraceae bacterium]